MPREVRESGMVAPQIVVQGDVTGVTVAFTDLVSGCDLDKLNERLDLYMRAISRQRAKAELVEALVDLRARREVLASMPERERDLARKRVEARVRLASSFEEKHRIAGKRADFQMTQPQRDALYQHDQQTEAEKAKLAEEKIALQREIPLYEQRVARQEAIIAGAERADVMREEPRAEAAD